MIQLAICAILEGFGKSLQDSMIVGHWWSTIFSNCPQNSFFTYIKNQINILKRNGIHDIILVFDGMECYSK